jgi:hypothetical protein
MATSWPLVCISANDQNDIVFSKDFWTSPVEKDAIVTISRGNLPRARQKIRTFTVNIMTRRDKNFLYFGKFTKG